MLGSVRTFVIVVNDTILFTLDDPGQAALLVVMALCGTGNK
jgi:hypothetical protein